MPKPWRLALLSLVLLPSRVTAFPPLDDVPEMGVRVRVTEADGKQPSSDDAFSLTVAREAAPPFQGSAWSEWMSPSREAIGKVLDAYPNSYNRRWQVKVPCTVRPAQGSRAVIKLEVETRLGASGEARRTPAELHGPSLGVIVWREEDSTATQIDTLAGHGRRVYDQAMKAATLPAEQRPKKILFGDRYIGGDNDAICWREGIRRLSGLGFNAMHGVPPQFVPVVREGGISKVWGAVYNPPGYAFNFRKDREQVFREFAAKQIEQALASGWRREDVAFWVTSDEPGWYYPATYEQFNQGPAALADFRAYLQRQRLRPADLGLESWDELRLIGRADYDDLPSRRLFYWSNRFVPWASSRFFSEVAKAYEAELGPGVPVMVNFNNFLGRAYQPGPVGNNKDKQSPNAAMGQHDWLEFGRLRGSTCIATEDWFGDASAWQWSFYATRLRSAAELSDVGFGALVIPRVSGQREEGMAQKLLSLVGHGAKTIKFFTFGPEYNFPGNCYSFNHDVYQPLALGMGIVGKAETLLHPGKMRRPETAIVTPQSSQLWDLEDQRVAKGLLDVTNTHPFSRHMAYLSETCGLHLALQHAAIPVQAIDEQACEQRDLEGLKLIYLTAPDLPREAAEGLLAWVRGGGTLVMTAGSGHNDRYHQPMSLLTDAAGVTPRSTLRPLLTSLTTWKEGPRVLRADRGDIASYGPHEPLTAGEAEVLAVLDNSDPAVTRRTLGKGSVYRFACFPGICYRRSAGEQTGGLPSGFAAAWRELIVEPAEAAGVARPVKVDRPLIEAPALHSDRGVAVTLLNWSGQRQQDVAVTLLAERRPSRVESARTGPLKMEVVQRDTPGQGFAVRVTLDLADVDVLSFHY